MKSAQRRSSVLLLVERLPLGLGESTLTVGSIEVLRGSLAAFSQNVDPFFCVFWFAECAPKTQEGANHFQNRAGLSDGDYMALELLIRADDGGLRQQEMADATGWTKSRLSHHLTRME